MMEVLNERKKKARGCGARKVQHNYGEKRKLASFENEDIYQNKSLY